MARTDGAARATTTTARARALFRVARARSEAKAGEGFRAWARAMVDPTLAVGKLKEIVGAGKVKRKGST